MVLFTIIFFITGLIVGSFINVCIWRIPRKESIVTPPSHCPKCSKRLKAINLIPVLSYVFQGGKCSFCGKSISVKYPLVEILTGFIFATTVYFFDLSTETFVYLGLFSILILITFIDLELKIIPDQIIVFGLIVGLIINLIRPLSSFSGGIIGFFSAGMLFLFIALISNGGMGGGDIKLAAMLGLWLGWKSVLVSLLLAVFIGAFVGVILIISGIKNRKEGIPFGPFMALGVIISTFWGNQILDWYTSHFLL